jgi:hypothetical protein
MGLSLIDLLTVLLLIAVPLGMLFFIIWRIYQQIAVRLANLERLQGGQQNDLDSLVSTATRQGERVVQLEQEMRRMNETQRELNQRQERILQGDGDGERSFDQAIKLARKGASIEEIMEICGLPRGEAELVTMMHRLNSPR